MATIKDYQIKLTADLSDLDKQFGVLGNKIKNIYTEINTAVKAQGTHARAEQVATTAVVLKDLDKVLSAHSQATKKITAERKKGVAESTPVQKAAQVAQMKLDEEYFTKLKNFRNAAITEAASDGLFQFTATRKRLLAEAELHSANAKRLTGMRAIALAEVEGDAQKEYAIKLQYARQLASAEIKAARKEDSAGFDNIAGGKLLKAVEFGENVSAIVGEGLMQGDFAAMGGTIGSMIGGPLGGAVGSAIGSGVKIGLQAYEAYLDAYDPARLFAAATAEAAKWNEQVVAMSAGIKSIDDAAKTSDVAAGFAAARAQLEGIKGVAPEIGQNLELILNMPGEKTTADLLQIKEIMSQIQNVAANEAMLKQFEAANNAIGAAGDSLAKLAQNADTFLSSMEVIGSVLGETGGSIATSVGGTKETLAIIGTAILPGIGTAIGYLAGAILEANEAVQSFSTAGAEVRIDEINNALAQGNLDSAETNALLIERNKLELDILKLKQGQAATDASFGAAAQAKLESTEKLLGHALSESEIKQALLGIEAEIKAKRDQVLEDGKTLLATDTEIANIIGLQRDKYVDAHSVQTQINEMVSENLNQYNEINSTLDQTLEGIISITSTEEEKNQLEREGLDVKIENLRAVDGQLALQILAIESAIAAQGASVDAEEQRLAVAQLLAGKQLEIKKIMDGQLTSVSALEQVQKNDLKGALITLKAQRAQVQEGLSGLLQQKENVGKAGREKGEQASKGQRAADNGERVEKERLQKEEKDAEKAAEQRQKQLEDESRKAEEASKARARVIENELKQKAEETAALEKNARERIKLEKDLAAKLAAFAQELREKVRQIKESRFAELGNILSEYASPFSKAMNIFTENMKNAAAAGDAIKQTGKDAVVAIATTQDQLREVYDKMVSLFPPTTGTLIARDNKINFTALAKQINDTVAQVSEADAVARLSKMGRRPTAAELAAEATIVKKQKATTKADTEELLKNVHVLQLGNVEATQKLNTAASAVSANASADPLADLNASLKALQSYTTALENTNAFLGQMEAASGSADLARAAKEFEPAKQALEDPQELAGAERFMTDAAALRAKIRTDLVSLTAGLSDTQKAGINKDLENVDKVTDAYKIQQGITENFSRTQQLSDAFHYKAQLEELELKFELGEFDAQEMQFETKKQRILQLGLKAFDEELTTREKIAGMQKEIDAHKGDVKVEERVAQELRIEALAKEKLKYAFVSTDEYENQLKLLIKNEKVQGKTLRNLKEQVEEQRKAAAIQREAAFSGMEKELILVSEKDKISSDYKERYNEIRSLRDAEIAAIDEVAKEKGLAAEEVAALKLKVEKRTEGLEEASREKEYKALRDKHVADVQKSAQVITSIAEGIPDVLNIIKATKEGDVSTAIETGAELTQKIGTALLNSKYPDVRVIGAYIVGAALIAKAVNKIIQIIKIEKETETEIAEKHKTVIEGILAIEQARLAIMQEMISLGAKSLDQAREQRDYLIEQHDLMLQQMAASEGINNNAQNLANMAPEQLQKVKEQLVAATQQTQANLDAAEKALAGERNDREEFLSAQGIDAKGSTKDEVENFRDKMNAALIEQGVLEGIINDEIAFRQSILAENAAIIEEEIANLELINKIQGVSLEGLQKIQDARRKALTEALALVDIDTTGMSDEQLEALLAQQAAGEGLSEGVITLVNTWLDAEEAVRAYNETVSGGLTEEDKLLTALIRKHQARIAAIRAQTAAQGGQMTGAQRGELMLIRDEMITRLKQTGASETEIAAFIASLPEFSRGGIVPGTKGAPVNIKAHAGELVIPAALTSAIMAAIQSPYNGGSTGFDLLGTPHAKIVGEGIRRKEAAIYNISNNINVVVNQNNDFTGIEPAKGIRALGEGLESELFRRVNRGLESGKIDTRRN